jgi:FkbH-like protein
MKPAEEFGEQMASLLAKGEHYAAWSQIRDRLENDSTLTVHYLAAELASQIDIEKADLRTLRVGVLGSFTLDSLVPLLKSYALASRIVAQVYLGNFNGWQIDALSEASRLHEFQPDVVVLALRAEDIVPNLVYRFLRLSGAEIKAEIAAATEALDSFIMAVRRTTASRVIVHSLTCPVFPALGIIDHQTGNGQGLAFRKLNEAWNDVAKNAGNVWIVDCDRLLKEVGWKQWYDPRLWNLARAPLTGMAIKRLAEEYVRYLRAILGLSRKVLALDLDNTLWGGIIGEDGFEGIELGPEYPGSAFVELQRVILGLQERGVVLAINSRNNEADAIEVIAKHPAMVLRPDHFAAKRINWNDKAQNLKDLAGELNLGLDAFVYVDDSAVDCERIRQELPEVLTIHMADEPALRAERLRRVGVFDTLSFSEEDRKRGTMYRQEGLRRQLQKKTPTIEEFYHSLQMELLVRRLDLSAAGRAAQLTQRTNQFNLTTRRYSEAEMRSLLESKAHEIYTVQLRDRFGDDGVVGLAVLRREESALHIEAFLMSCRVVARGVETAFLTYLLKRAEEMGVATLVGEFRRTKKNEIAADFYQKQGFRETSRSFDESEWQLDRSGFRCEYPPWFRVRENGDSTA